MVPVNAPTTATAVTPAGTSPPTSTTGADGRTSSGVAAVANLDPADPAQARANVSGLAVLRLGKGLLGAAVAAGLELANIERQMGTEFPGFIAGSTMLTVVEARTLIAFAARAGLQPEQLTAAHAVSLDRVLRAVALLGRLYLAETEAAEPRQEGVGAQTE